MNRAGCRRPLAVTTPSHRYLVKMFMGRNGIWSVAWNGMSWSLLEVVALKSDWAGINLLRSHLIYERSFWYFSSSDELLPPKSDTQHNLRKRRHDLTLPEKKGHLSDKNFIIRMLYKETYWLLSCIIHNLSFSSFIVTLLRSVSSVFTIKIEIKIEIVMGFH